MEKNMISEVKKLKCGTVLENVDMRKYTTYKAGGLAKLMVFPKNVKQLIKLLEYIKNNNIKYKVLGKGSNVLFGDSLYEGIIIKLDEFKDIKIDGTKIIVGAGYSLIKLSLQTARLGLTGLEFASGIPGSIGGAVFMNAGAYKSDMGYIVKEVKVLTPKLEVKTLSNKEMDFHYRTSFLQKNSGYICLEATIVLKKGNRDLILEVINDRKRRRIEAQPLEFPSAGSVFRNPEGDYAGRLIEEAGYKGKRIGDAKVSDKHANFIINVGRAKGDDIKKLILEIKDVVKKKYNIDLKIEQEFVE
ncbi:MAG: UDP-N-acetylmuramate dehydrogenase [Firmicutes bacterium]|nr:UDP-N-acetylmuramate dehydrogenase [Bacillota bacterium]